MSTIGSACLPVQSGDPKKLFETAEFTYIDIASIDQAEKRIRGPKRLAVELAPSRARQQVQPGDILVSTVRPNLNAVAQVDSLTDAIASTGFCVLRPDEHRLSSRYLFHWVKSPSFIDEMVRQATGASYPAVTDAIVKSSRIPLPTMDEQRRIAAILDKAEELRAKRRAAIALLDQLPQSIFLEMFGEMNAKAVTLGDYTERVTKGTTPTTLGFSFTYSGIPLLRVQNLREDRIDFTEDVLYIARDTHLALARSQIRPGDVLTTIAGTIGRTVIVPGDAPEANCNQAIAIITPKADLHRQYLRYWLSSPAAQRQISQGQVTATISNLSLGQIKGLTIPLPNLELQQRFAIRVEAVQRAKTAQLSALFEIDALFSSLQESAFGGHP